MANLLIVDDHADDQYLYRTILEAAGHAVMEARNGMEALEVARATPPDLVISDVLMPLMDGFQLCREWQQDPTFRHVPFIFCSATYMQPAHLQLAHDLGARQFLLKPIDLELLRRTVSEALAESPVLDATARLRQLDEPLFHSRHAAAMSEKVLEQIQELEEANRRLVQQEQAFRHLFECNPLPMWVFDLNTLAFLAVNDAAVDHYGWSREEFLQMTIAEIRPPEDVARLMESAQKTPEGVDHAGQWRHCLRSGDVIDVQITGHRISFEGHPAELIVARDITEQKKAERAVALHLLELEAMLSGAVTTIMKLGELRDPYTAGHERRVGELSAALGKELGLDDRFVQGLAIMGQLHDVGKMSVPAETLVKPTRLSALEFELVKQHAEHSYEILRHVEFPWPVAEAARQHHERLDGSGYPRGLQGSEIMLEARILAVADTVEAMSSHRPYRAALGIDRAMAEIEQGAGSVYDPEVVAACLRLFRERDFQFSS